MRPDAAPLLTIVIALHFERIAPGEIVSGRAKVLLSSLSVIEVCLALRTSCFFSLSQISQTRFNAVPVITEKDIAMKVSTCC